MLEEVDRLTRLVECLLAVARAESGHPTHALSTLTNWAEQQGIEFPSLTVTRPSLEDTYLELVGDSEEAKVPEAVA